MGGWADATSSIVGSTLGFATDITGLVLGQKNFNKQMDLANQQLNLQKEQFKDAKERYNTAKQNQEKGIAALGASFGEALQRENAQGATPSPANGQSPTQTPSQTLAGTSPAAGALGAPAPAAAPQTQPTTPAAPAQSTPALSQENQNAISQLPTQRH